MLHGILVFQLTHRSLEIFDSAAPFVHPFLPFSIMSPGNAEASAESIYAQLVALYKNAVARSDWHQITVKPESDKVEYGTCLRIYFAPNEHIRALTSSEDSPFHAKFAEPHLEFVCNHKVLLHLHIEEGYCRSDGDNIHRYVSVDLGVPSSADTRLDSNLPRSLSS